ncbi:WecB/TagA/CpsF family glycosyltransferase [bacterium]|nr:MAG: WecB/TagA/CpsF family glycosyltransferase [bacterium]
MSKQSQFEKVDILGVDIDIVAADEAIESILEASKSGQPASYIVKPYVEFLDTSYHNLEVRELLDNAQLCLADGVALIWAAAYLYAGPRNWRRFLITLSQIIWQPRSLLYPLTDRGAGINFTSRLLKSASQAGRRIALVGSPTHQNIETTANTLRQIFPDINIVSVHHGHDPQALADRQSTAWLSALATQLGASQPDIVLLGLGFPRQEFAAAYLSAHVSHGVFIGEGGSFDYQAFGGKRSKAPQFIQSIGLEWLWRLGQEPTRWRRQLAIPRFIWRVWRQGRQ